MKEAIKKHPFFTSVISSFLVALCIVVGIMIWNALKGDWYWSASEAAYSILTLSFFGGIFFVYPFLLTGINIVSLFIHKEGWKKTAKGFEFITIILGSIYSILVTLFYEICFDSDWWVQLVNSQVHTPIYTQSVLSVAVIAVVAVAGYLLLSFVKIQKMPPLVIVCSIAAMYLGIVECTLWIVQLFPDLFLSLLPFNCIVIAIRTTIVKVKEWNEREHEEKHYDNPFMEACNKIMMKSSNWPWIALILMWPLLGILICILVLFGQKPDAVIKAWTETADWNLSQRVGPQNIYYDEHYLCTVAAGGHEKVVKPVRLGERHGHKVIVNRQLCVANAFEQILEEKTPNFHRHVRHFYDTYGFPIAKLIHSPFVADVIYFVMKPLEWMFLIVLYFCDVNPENRIAVQYLPKEGSSGI